MRAVILALLLLLPTLSGCASGIEDRLRGSEEPGGFSPVDTRIFKFIESNVTVTVSDGVQLRATYYEPRPWESTDRFPVVISIHGWGGDRGTSAAPRRSADPVVGELRELAKAGFAVVAYDVRGFGESGGQSTLAGPREMEDMRQVIDWAVNATVWNGKLGIVGRSYGGGHAMWALVHDERVTTVVSQYGWIDLADGLAPGNVPKHGWVATLLGVGLSGGGDYDPVIYDWVQAAATRDGLDEVIAQLQARSTFRDLGNVTKPILFIEGTDETLFPQAFDAYRLAANSTDRKVYLFDGGHGNYNPDAWDRARDWFGRHLKGEATGSDSWPRVSAPASWARDRLGWDGVPVPGTDARAFLLADDSPQDGVGALADAAGPAGRAQYAGTGRSGALDDAGVLVDSYRFRPPAAPTQLRAVPGESMVFRGEPFNATRLIVGSPWLNVTLAPGAQPGLQVAPRLYVEGPDGNSRLISRGSLDPSPLSGEAAFDIPLTRVLTQVLAGERLVLVIGADDTAYTAPYPRPFTASVVFGGESGARLTVPFVDA